MRAGSPGTAPSISSGWPASASCAPKASRSRSIGRVLSGDLDAMDAPLAVAVAVADAPEELLSLAELAERSAVPPALLEAVARGGLARRRASTTAPSATRPPTSTSSAPGLALLEAGFPLSDLLALAREHNDATHDIAEQAVGLFDRYVRVPLRESDSDGCREGRNASSTRSARCCRR